MCYTDKQLRDKIQTLSGVHAYNKVLLLQRLATGPPSVKGTQEEGESFLDSSTKTAHHVEGNKPPDYLNLALHNTAADRQYGLASLKELAKVLDYLKMNGNFALKPVQNRGFCLFASIRRGIGAPLEYSNTHLRRQIVVLIIDNIAFLWSLLMVHISGNYGHLRLSSDEYRVKQADGTLTQQQIQDYNEPGPFSIVGYLQQLLNRTFLGEEIVLVIISMMWQIKINVLHAESLLQTKIRHNNRLSKADLLLHCSANHYVPARLYIIVWDS